VVHSGFIVSSLSYSAHNMLKQKASIDNGLFRVSITMLFNVFAMLFDFKISVP
jgi:hypothetical protein